MEDIEEPTMQEIRYLDKLIDELAKGKVMEKIPPVGVTSMVKWSRDWFGSGPGWFRRCW